MRRSPLLGFGARRAFSSLLLCALVVAFGCKDGSKTAIISGKVTYKNAPVTGGTIQFTPAKGGPAIPGIIGADGTYSAPGVATGEMIVTVETESAKFAGSGYDMSKAPAGVDGSKAPEIKKLAYVEVPKKYNDKGSSPLRYEVKGGKETKDFELTD